MGRVVGGAAGLTAETPRSTSSARTGSGESLPATSSSRMVSGFMAPAAPVQSKPCTAVPRDARAPIRLFSLRSTPCPRSFQAIYAFSVPVNCLLLGAAVGGVQLGQLGLLFGELLTSKSQPQLQQQQQPVGGGAREP